MWSYDEIIKINREMFESMPTFALNNTKKDIQRGIKNGTGEPHYPELIRMIDEIIKSRG